MRRRSAAFGSAFLLGAIACSALGAIDCQGSPRSTAECPSAEGAPIDQATMAFLSMARALHHEADIDEARGDAASAIEALERLVGAPAPPGPEGREVLADAHARLAEFRLRQRDLDGADRDVRAGLDSAREPTYFRGHLLEVQGLVEEARAGALADAAKTDEAQRARAKAIRLLEEAVHVQEQVIERALADGGVHG